MVDQPQRRAAQVICDEAHVMRTISTLLGKAMRKIQARCRILLTGTPVQHLGSFWNAYTILWVEEILP